MQKRYMTQDNGDYLIICDFGDRRYTAKSLGRHWCLLSWSHENQETPFDAIPYGDIYFFKVVRHLTSFRNPQPVFPVFVLLGDTMEQINIHTLTRQMSAQTFASHPIWCPVANMRQEHPTGPGGQEIKRGTSDIAPGAKVYCHPTTQGDGYERVPVTMHHRVSHRLITIYTAATWLEHWRVELVYEPGLIKRLIKDWDWTPESKMLAESLVRQGEWWGQEGKQP
jgi:hypothetical protein